MWSYFLTGCTTAAGREWLWGIHDDGQWSYNWNAMVFVCSECRFVDVTLEIVFFFQYALYVTLDMPFDFASVSFYSYLKNGLWDQLKFYDKEILTFYLLSVRHARNQEVVVPTTARDISSGRVWTDNYTLEEISMMWVPSTQGVCNISWEKSFLSSFFRSQFSPTEPGTMEVTQTEPTPTEPDTMEVMWWPLTFVTLRVDENE